MALTFTVTLTEQERDDLIDALRIAVHEFCLNPEEAEPWDALMSKLAELKGVSKLAELKGETQ